MAGLGEPCCPAHEEISEETELGTLAAFPALLPEGVGELQQRPLSLPQVPSVSNASLSAHRAEHSYPPRLNFWENPEQFGETYSPECWLKGTRGPGAAGAVGAVGTWAQCPHHTAGTATGPAGATGSCGLRGEEAAAARV